MSDELIDIYNKSNQPLGFSKTRNEVHKKGLWHRAAHVWMYNSAGEVLFQLRAESKKFYPGTWTPSSAGGHINAGESEIVAIVREIKEELGVDIKESDLSFFKIMKEERMYKKMNNKEFHYVYLHKFDGDIKLLKLQRTEVERVEFFSTDKIDEELETKPEKYLLDKEYWKIVSAEIKKRVLK